MGSMDEIYQQHAQTVYKYLMTLCGNASLAEEITQETFFQAIKGINSFDGSCRITTWLCSIARNQLYAWYRKNPAAVEPQEEDRITDGADEVFLKKEEKIRLLKCIHHLPDTQKEVVQLRIYGNLSFSEIGEVFVKSENWARVTFYRAKENLRKELLKDE